MFTTGGFDPTSAGHCHLRQRVRAGERGDRASFHEGKSQVQLLGQDDGVDKVLMGIVCLRM